MSTVCVTIQYNVHRVAGVGNGVYKDRVRTLGKSTIDLV